MAAADVDLVRRAYARFAEEQDPFGDWAWLDRFVDPERLTLHPQGIYFDAAHEYRGLEGWVAFWKEFGRTWEAFWFEVVDVLDARDRVVVITKTHARGRDSGIEVTVDEAHVWRVENGLLMEARPSQDVPGTLRDLGLA